jgi:hypothetical protein
VKHYGRPQGIVHCRSLISRIDGVLGRHFESSLRQSHALWNASSILPSNADSFVLAKLFA